MGRPYANAPGACFPLPRNLELGRVQGIRNWVENIISSLGCALVFTDDYLHQGLNVGVVSGGRNYPQAHQIWYLLRAREIEREERKSGLGLWGRQRWAESATGSRDPGACHGWISGHLSQDIPVSPGSGMAAS